jgi:ABC-type Zn2+ transport system substrate-binding protein/surface adhesin
LPTFFQKTWSRSDFPFKRAIVNTTRIRTLQQRTEANKVATKLEHHCTIRLDVLHTEQHGTHAITTEHAPDHHHQHRYPSNDDSNINTFRLRANVSIINAFRFRPPLAHECSYSSSKSPCME